MKKVLRGTVQSGQNGASRWLGKFNDAYSAKTGLRIFPGSLNLVLEQAFDWDATEIQGGVIFFAMQEYGGERDIFMLPCRLTSLDGRKAFLWTPTTVARGRNAPAQVEIITDINLRHAFGLQDGDPVEFDIAVSGSA